MLDFTVHLLIHFQHMTSPKVRCSQTPLSSSLFEFLIWQSVAVIKIGLLMLFMYS